MYVLLYIERFDEVEKDIDKIQLDLTEANSKFEFEMEVQAKDWLWFDFEYEEWRVSQELYDSEKEAGDFAVRGWLRKHGFIWTFPLVLQKVVKKYTGSVHLWAEHGGDFAF